MSLPNWPIGAPGIDPLGRPMPGRPRNHITSATYIQLRADTPEQELYFTTDGTDPDPFHRIPHNRSHTHKYKGPFKLKPGRRTIRALAIDRINKEESAVSGKTFLVEDVSLARLREDDELSRVTLASEGESTMSELTLNPQVLPEPPKRRSGLNGYTSGDLTDTTLTEDEFMITPRSSILDEDSEVDSYFQSSHQLVQNGIRPHHERRYIDRVDTRFDSGDSDLETDVSNFFHKPRSHSHSPSRMLRPRSRSKSRTRSRSRSRSKSRTRSRSRSPSTYTDLRLTPDTDVGTYTPRTREQIRDEINQELLASDLETARRTARSNAYSNADAYQTHRTYSPTSVPTPRTLHSIPCTSVDTTDSWKARETIDQTHYTRPTVNGHHGPSGLAGPYHSSSLPYSDRLGADRGVRYSDTFVDRLREPAYRSDLRSSVPVAEPFPYPDIRVPPSMVKDTSKSYDVGEKYCSAAPLVNGHAAPPSFDVDVPRHHCTHGRGPDRFHAAPRLPSYGEHSQSRRAWEHEGKDPREVTFEKQDKEEMEIKEKDKEKEEEERQEKKDKKEKKEKKDKKNKKKKKKDKGSSSSSSSSSGSGSDSDSDSEKDSKKKKKKKDKKKDKSKKKEKKDKDTKEDKIKDNQPPPDMSPVVKTDRDMIQAPHMRQPANGRMNFYNDSGTQINYWGMKPDEVNRVVNGVLRGNIPYADPRGQGQGYEHEHEHDEADFGYPGDAQAWQHHGLPAPQEPHHPGFDHDHESDEEPVPHRPTSSTKRGPRKRKPHAPLAKAQQQDQQSVGGFFKKFFKGWGSKSEEKDKDPRSTVRSVDDKGDGKASYERIRDECLKKGKLWEDPDFPAHDSSLYFSKEQAVEGVKWMRPSEICDNPQMFVGGASRFDIKQGVLGNCWLLAAISSLTTSPKLLGRVVPLDQSFEDRYAGVFRFRFWQYGKWMEVCVDDRLPTKDGQLIYMHSVDNNEFWSPMMEKAYAKLSGNYESLAGGLSSEAMTDFTGGVVERYTFTEDLPDNLFQVMLKAKDRQSLMGCSIDASPDSIEDELDNGLIIGHAYSVTDVKQLESSDGTVELVRVRNPWGNDCEWKGAWSDESDEWQSLTEKDKKLLGLNFEHDGEFWMSYQDFSTNFQRLEICHLGPDALEGEGDEGTHWESQVIPGGWKKKVNAGGCRNYPETYWTNPQYRVKITDADDDDDEDVGTVIVGLMQKGRRERKQYGEGNLTIGYDLFRIEKSQKGTLEREFFQRHRPSATAPNFINMREVCGRHRLPPGEYCVVPTSFEPNEEADFIVRVFSEKEGALEEMDDSTCIVRAAATSEVHSAPPGLQSGAKKRFKEYGGEDLEIDAYELRDILNEVFKKDFEHASFDINLCRSIVALTDVDQTGKLAWEEFKSLWTQLQAWKASFKEFDADSSGYFNSYELRNALKSVGHQLSNATFNTVVMRYSDKAGRVQFDDYVACIVKLKSLFAIYGNCHKEGQEQANFELDEFIQLTIYS